MLLAILAFWWGYKKAKATGRNAALWSVICGLTFIGIQLAVGLGMGLFVGVGAALWGWDETVLDRYSILFTLGSFLPAIITLLLLFRYLDRIPEESPQTLPPPPPSTFGPNS